MNIPENKEFYVSILDGIDTGVWAVDKNENFIFFNSAMERISGLKKSETIGSNLMTDIPGQTMDGEAQFRKLFRNVRKSLETTSYGPIPIITPKGDLSYQSGDLIPQFDENGQYDGLVCTVVDITKRKHAEEEMEKLHYNLNERYKELNLLYEISKLAAQTNLSTKNVLQKAVALIPPAWQYPDITCARITLYEQEYTSQNFTKTRWEQSAPIKIFGQNAGLVEVCYLKEMPQIYEGSFLKEERDLINTVAKHLVGIIEHKLAGKALQDSELRLIRAQKIAHMGDWEYDIEADRYTGSDEVYRIFDIDPATELSYELLQEMVHPDDRDLTDKHTKNLIEGGIGESFEHRIVRPDGSIRYIYAQGEVALDSTGKVKLFGILLDITERKRAEEALRESEEKYRSLFESSMIGIGLGKDNRIISANLALLDIFGYETLEEIVRVSILDHVAPESKHLITEMRKRWGRGERKPQKVEYRIIRKDGEKRDLEAIFNRVNIAGETYSLGTFVDITERKRAEDKLLKKNRNLSILYSTASIATEYNNIDDILGYVLSELLDYQGSEAGGVYLLDKESDEIVLRAHKGLSDEFVEKVRCVPLNEPAVAAIMASKDVFIEEPCRSEEIIELEKEHGIEKVMTIKLQARDKAIGFVNVTLPAEYEILEEDALVLESVGKQIGIVIENLCLFNETEKAYKELKSLDRMKDEFLSNVSHELKTPLVSIEGYSEVLNAGTLGALNERQKKAADAIMRNADRLERLINSILYLSIEESGKMKYTFKPLQIADVIEHSVLDMLPQIKKNNLRIKKQVPDNLSLIKGDEERLILVISNLIGNAIKFTPSGEITISAHEDDDKLHIAVNDTGIGIPQEEINNLFKRFYQADGSTTRRYGGTGLGLYISKLITEAHNGKIWAESEKGVGTTIHVTLPK